VLSRQINSLREFRNPRVSACANIDTAFAYARGVAPLRFWPLGQPSATPSRFVGYTQPTVPREPVGIHFTQRLGRSFNCGPLA